MERPSPTSTWSSFIEAWAETRSEFWTRKFWLNFTFRIVYIHVVMSAVKMLFESKWARCLAGPLGGTVVYVVGATYYPVFMDWIGELLYGRPGRRGALEPPLADTKLAPDVSEHGRTLTTGD
ncbi:hypothetical protein B0T19DRAFT_446865 [Cercophora scortea]|uniref:Uncharacterized protein n=1 Tax=Cercophora scortea TaxID=314031 RepID=A0AAE0I3Y4_9PEZI|nr:hypothetical protein B0T19DRAFT_446865 [Cercophora scortea]